LKFRVRRILSGAREPMAEVHETFYQKKSTKAIDYI